MFMQVINFIMDAGSSVFMPVIIFALGLVFGLKPSKSFGAGITVGIGFIGINLVIELLANNLMVVIDQLVELYHFKLTPLTWGGRLPQASPGPAKLLYRLFWSLYL